MQNNYLKGLPLALVTIALALGTFLIVLDYSIANVSIPYIAGDLGVNLDQGTYVITSFAVGNAIALALTGWLTKRVGAVRLLILSVVLFTFFSWACGAAYNFFMLILCRFIQGAVSGPLIPLSQSLIISTRPPEQRNAALSFWSTIVIVAPIVGPMLGGWITFDYNWRWIFYINIPVGIVAAMILWTYLTDRETAIEKEPLDFVGFILLAVGVTCLQVLLDKGEQWDWQRSPAIRTLGVISFVSLTFLVGWDLTTKKPLLDLRLFKISSFAVSVIVLAFAYAIYFGTVVLVPLWLQANMGYNSIWAGLAVAPIGIVPALLSLLGGKMITKWGKLIPLFLCFLFFALSSFYSAYFTTDVDFAHVAFSRFLLGFGLFFFFTPLIALSVQDIPLDKLPSATGIFHFVRAMVGAVGTSLFVTLWDRRIEHHHLDIGSVITPFNPNATQIFTDLKAIGITGKSALDIVNNLLNNQSALLAINECFFLMGWIFLGLTILLPFARGGKKVKS